MFRVWAQLFNTETFTFMLLTQARYLLITGENAPNNHATVEARVVSRLEVLCSRVLILDATLEEGDEGFEEGFTSDTLPASLAEAIAYGIKTVLSPQTSNIPSGVSSFGIDGAYNVAVASGQIITADLIPISSRYAFAADLGGRCVTLALRHRWLAL